MVPGPSVPGPSDPVEVRPGGRARLWRRGRARPRQSGKLRRRGWLHRAACVLREVLPSLLLTQEEGRAGSLATQRVVSPVTLASPRQVEVLSQRNAVAGRHGRAKKNLAAMLIRGIKSPTTAVEQAPAQREAGERPPNPVLAESVTPPFVAASRDLPSLEKAQVSEPRQPSLLPSFHSSHSKTSWP